MRQQTTDRLGRAVVLGSLPCRVLAEMAWWVPLGFGVTLRQAVTLCLVPLWLVIAWNGRERIPRQLLHAVGALWGLLVVGGLRSSWELEALTIGLREAAPFAFFLAVVATEVPAVEKVRVIRATAAALFVTVLLSLGLYLWGAPLGVDLHGFPRWVGVYKNLHDGALTLAVASVFGLTTGGLLGGGLLCGSLLLLVLTWVRTGLLLVVISSTTVFVRRRQWRALFLGVSLLLVALVVSAGLRERFSFVGALLMGTPDPSWGWDLLGSSRIYLWRLSLTDFLTGGPSVWAFGVGLDGVQYLGDRSDPHSDLLLLLYQMGLFGPFAWLWLLGLCLRRSLRERTTSGTLFLGLGCGALFAVMISNTFVSRLTPALLLWGAAGLAWSSSTRSLDPRGSGMEQVPGPCMN